MRHDREKVFELRKEGKSYREIQSLIKISRDTLSQWFKNEKWSNHIKTSNTKKHIKISTDHLRKLNEGRKAKLDEQYSNVEQDAKKEFELYRENPLFIAGLMLYIGEGDKVNKRSIRLANTDFYVHKVFIKFLTNFMGVNAGNLKISILLYPDLNVEECQTKWSQELNIPFANFYKPQVIQGKHPTKRLHFGVGTAIVSSSFLKRKLFVWMELAKRYLTNQTLEAAIV